MKNSKAFTLVEVLIATFLIGLAIASLLGANMAFTQANGDGANLSTAEFLIDQIREFTAMLPVIDPQSGTSTFGAEEASLANYDDLDDFDGKNFSPPITAGRDVLTNFSAFSQRITVENVSASNFDLVIADHGSRFVRVTVKIYLNSKQINLASWIRARY